MKMLRRLKGRLTALNAVVSGIILCLIITGTLLYTRAQFLAGAQNEFAHTADTIAYQLQSDSLVRHSYLTELELSQGLILYLEEGGVPYRWKGVYEGETSRESLVARARALAAENGILTDYAPIRSHNYLSMIDGDYGDSYRLSVWALPGEHSYTLLTVLKDTRQEKAVLTQMTGIFAGCALLGIAVQILFSTFFAGRAIQPIARADREQKEFVQAASHELRTPLSVMQTSLDAMDKADKQLRADFMASVRRQCRHMARLVDDLLLLASADAHALKLNSAPVEIDALLKQTADAFMPVIKENGLHLNALAIHPRVLWADSAKLEQVIYILVDNAIEHTPVGGEITVSGVDHKDRYEITVSDSGSGIPAEHKEHIFDRFYRIDRARNRDKAHYGLGLSIAQEIVNMHGGGIRVAGGAEAGAVFTVSIPHSNK